MYIQETKVRERSQDNYTYRSTWIQLMRPMTLTGSISPILAATALAALHGSFQLEMLILLILASVLVQAAINMLNDYFDFQQEQDKWATPTSMENAKGPLHHHIPPVAFYFFVLAAMMGILLSLYSSFWLIVVGTITFMVGFSYSAGSRPLCTIGLGEFDAALCYGPAPILMAFIVQGYLPNAEILALSLPFSMLIASMILANNIRDMKKDIGFRRTLPMMIGRIPAFYLLITLITIAYTSVFGLIYFQTIPWTSILSLLALPYAFKLIWVYRPQASRPEEIKGMKIAAIHHWIFGLSFATGIVTMMFI